MFDVQTSISPAVELLRDLRDRVEAIREPIREALKGPIKDNVMRHVQDRIAKEPGPVYHPFAFKTDQSRAWYMWYKRTRQFPSQDWNDEGGEWDRTGTLVSSWDVETNFGQNDGFIRIFNNAIDEKGDPYSKAVYGPDAVEGHIDTGWSSGDEELIGQIAGEVLDDVLNAAVEAITGFRS